ncbi:piRNA biogenesis protein EXD1-like isoform X2 [Hyla sarda]|uniref:piRNA biogenesis protein EXD1-like isoform X2 n=1 Tax=Hyla sarda TaxID=327740 RepID=UPI0024C391A9|nr:piRNA biogenesis protein EXD1-like isoform X2 [Hyla sarda]
MPLKLHTGPRLCVCARTHGSRGLDWDPTRAGGKEAAPPSLVSSPRRHFGYSERAPSLPWRIPSWELTYSFSMDLVAEREFLSKLIGRNIKITTVHGCFQGELFHIDAARAIMLTNVETAAEEPPKRVSQEQKEPNNERNDGALSLEEMKSALDTKEFSAAAAPIMKQMWNVEIMKYSDEEDINYVLIDQFQPMFGLAIRHLKNQKVLSLSAVAVDMSLHGKLCCLQVATKSWVYIFDIHLLGPGVFKNGLQMVLEDKGILKVIHDCRWLGNFLSQRYSVMLTNVFDTQVADVYLFSMETGGFLPSRTSTVRECLTRYLNLSSSQVSFLTFVETFNKDNPNIWCSRPLPTDALKLLVVDVIHLLDLRSAMLDAMLKDYTLLVDGYLNGNRLRTSAGFFSSETTSTELPEELQQLSVLQQRRREQALKDYQVNSRGFLERAEK